jgi:enediyne biosynthesis protein E4
MTRHLCILLLLANILLSSCGDKQGPTPLFQLQENTGISFTNKVQNAPDFNIFRYRNFYNGGGVAIGDINNDGLADVLFTANMGSNKLYLNKGNWNFEDISAKAGFTEKSEWSTGVVMADVNSDGWLDIYICNAGYQQGVGQQDWLFINNKDLTFTESSAQYGLKESGYTTHASFFDYDVDGDLDLFLLNNSFIPVNKLNYSNNRKLRAKDWPVADFFKGGGSVLFRNDGGKFTDVSEQAGIYGSLISFGLGITVGDVNGDNYPDIYISNDFYERDYLYINQKNGTFSEELESRTQHISMSSMGADMCDVNNDGYPDIFVTDMLPDDDYRLKTTSSFDNYDIYRLKVNQGFYHQYMQNTLQLNNTDGTFKEIGFFSGVAASDWSWGALMFDADNDGFADLYVCNGIYHDVTDQDFIDFFGDEVIQNMVLTGQKEAVDNVVNKMPSRPIPNKAFRNLGNLRFADQGNAWGLSQTSFSNGAAYGDLDNDGDLDLVVNNVNQPSFVYKNNAREQNTGNYLGVSLKGKGNNTFAIGSKVCIYQGSNIITREVIPGRGFQSSVDYKVVVGLGKGEADSMRITWPDGSVSSFNKPAINKVHVVQQPAASTKPTLPAATAASPMLDSVAHVFDKHQEDEFVDFYFERTIPVMVSREGPKAAVGDVNGDGLEDVYIGGAARQPGQLYLQTPNGFEKKKVQDFEILADFEDVAAVFFDCDGDKDLDLFVGAGGNNQRPMARELQSRLYKNDGQGNFKITGNAFPANSANISIAVPHDFDNDGDLDLFIGARSLPYNYGTPPSSHIYINNGKGEFLELVLKGSGPFAIPGMVTGAVWADVHSSPGKELVVAGEWMSPRIYSYDGKTFNEISSNLQELSGWWQSIAAADLDGDGDQDLVLGNIGENFYLKPDKEHPVKMWINDFDKNGAIEKVLTRTVNNRDVTVFLKRDLTDQLPSLRKQNLKHEQFAGKSIRELLPVDMLDKSMVNIFNYAPSIIALNDGNGKFTIRPLPAGVQLSSVHSILCTDVDGDGRTDLLLGGNQFNFLPQFSRLDASYGHLLLNKGGGVFTDLPAGRSGVMVREETRDIKEIKSKSGNYYLFLRNDKFPVLYRKHDR